MRIALLYDDVDARPHATPDERGVLHAVDAVRLALGELGHDVVRIPVGPELHDWAGRLADAAVDRVFNLCEGAGGRSDREPHVAAVVELMGIPQTGSTAETLALARRKDRVNALLAQHRLPVPEWSRVEPNGRAAEWRHFPAIVKPIAEDASIGISERSVARKAAELTAALDHAAPFAPLMVQQFLTGRELIVGIVGTHVLPVSEIEFALPPGTPPLVGYRAKWQGGSAEDRGTTPRCPATLDAGTRDHAVALALAAWHLVGGRGYGRVDLRADAEGRLHLLEVNANPDLAPGAGLARMAAAQGWSHRDLVERILAEAA